MKRVLSVLLLTIVALAQASAASFTPGNVVVLKCDGAVSAGNTGSLLEYLPTTPFTLVQTIPLSGMVFGSTANLAHDITLSADGALVIIPGYSKTDAAGVEASTAASNPRVIASVKWDGTVSYYTNSAFASAVAERGITADGFGNFWGTITSGTRWLSTTNPTASISLSGTGARGCAIFNGQLYVSTGSTVNSAGSGTPTGSASLTGVLNSVPNANVYTFALPAGAPVDGSTAYVGVYSGTPIAVFVYTYNSGAWSQSGTLTTPSLPAHIAVDYSQSPHVIYCTAPSAGNKLLSFTDPGGNATPTTTQIASVTSPAILRGVCLAPTQPALPVFTTQPTGGTVNYGDTISFGAVAATGANPNAWTWKHGSTTLTDGGRISGSTTTTLTISGVTAGDAGSYYAIAANNGGTTQSDPAVLTLQGTCILPQLVSITNAAGTTATFTAGTSSCQGPISSYSWTLNGNPVSNGDTGHGSTITGADGPVLTITTVQDLDAGNYTVTLIDGNSQPNLSAATLTVDDIPTISNPANQDKAVGGTANFSVTATGGDLVYHWYKSPSGTPLANGPSGNGATISGATTSHLVLTGVQSGDAGTYYATASNLAGTTPSATATLVVGLPPTFTSAPVSQVATQSMDSVITAVATGSGTITYSWKLNGTTLTDDGFHIGGSSTSSLGITNVQLTDVGTYTVTATSSYGSAAATINLLWLYGLPQPQGIPGLIIYEPFIYPVTDYPGFPAPSGYVNSWQNMASAWNEVTHQAAYWERLGGPYDNIEDPSTGPNALANSGQFPLKGINCNGLHNWYWSSAPNNNHFNFGGVDQANGAAYFSFMLHITQGSPLTADKYDVIAGLTTGIGSANADNWVYKLCTHSSNGGDSYQLGLFKGQGSTISSGSVNGQWVPVDYGRGGVHFIVCCYKFNSGTNLVGGSITNDDVISLWIDPDRSTFGAAPANVPAPSAGGMITNWSPNAPITEFALKGTVEPASKRISDLRIGTTWASVTQPYYPKLTITTTPTDVTVSWPSKDSPYNSFNNTWYGYSLQSGSTLGTLGADGTTPVLDGTGTNLTVTETLNAPQFYRLLYP